MADRPVARICDSLWNPLGELSSFDNLSVTFRGLDVGEGKLDVTAPTDEDREYLSRGHHIQIVEDGEVTQSGILNKLGESSGDATVNKPSWVDLNEHLRRAQLFANPGSDSGQGPATHDVRGGFTSSVVLGYVDANIGPSALPRRRAAGVVMGGDPQAGVYLNTPAAARFDNALDFLKSLAMTNGVVWDWDTDDRVHYFRVRQIADRSAEVQYSAALNNLGAGEWTITAPAATEVHVFGPGEGTEQMIFRVQTDESRAAAVRWGRNVVAILSSSSMMTDDAAKAAAAVEVENLKTWVSSWKDGLGNVTDAYKKLDRILRDLDLTLGDTYIGPVTADAIAAERDLVIKVADEIGLQLAVFGDSSFDIDLEKDLNEQQLAALVELKRVRDGYQQGSGNVPGASIINGVQGAMDALTRVHDQYPTGFNVKQQVALDTAVEAFAFLGAKIDLFLSTQPVVAGYKQKALDFTAAAVVANRDLTFRTLYAQAEQKLAESGETVELSYQIDATGSFEFGRDVFINDLVSVWPEGAPEPFVKPIREATITWSVSAGRQVKLTVGDYAASSGTSSEKQLRQIISIVRNLQTRR